MKVQPAAFLRTTLPLELSRLGDLDSGRYHSVWLPDHMPHRTGGASRTST